MISDLPRKLVLARKRRLQLFAFVNELNTTTTHSSLHVKYIWGDNCIFQKWQQPGFSQKRCKKGRKRKSRFTKRNQIHPSQQKYLLEQERYMYFDQAYPGSALGPGHCLSKKDSLERLLTICTTDADCFVIVAVQRYGGTIFVKEIA